MENFGSQISQVVTYDADLVQSLENCQETVILKLREVSSSKIDAVLEIIQPGQYLIVTLH